MVVFYVIHHCILIRVRLFGLTFSSLIGTRGTVTRQMADNISVDADDNDP